MGKCEVIMVFEVIEYEVNERVCFVSDEGGIVWDLFFEICVEGRGIKFIFIMYVCLYKLLVCFFVLLMMCVICGVIEKDFVVVKMYCEFEMFGLFDG